VEIILNYFSSFEIYIIILFVIFVGATAQSSIGIGFGIPGCIIILTDPSMIPISIVLMGTFLAFSNAFLNLKDIFVKDLLYALSGRVIGTLLSVPLITLTIGTNSFLIIFAILLLITIPLSALKWNLKANKKNIALAGTCSGFMGTLTGIGGPPMGIVYQNSERKNVVATLNMFFGLGALFSVIVLAKINLLNTTIAIKCLFLAPGLVAGIIFGRLESVKNFVKAKFKFLILAVCVISSLLVLLLAFTS
tara:strand:- start:77 stop:823 length:747 start_codon:yes stop_codon:yes gene_type:complete